MVGIAYSQGDWHAGTGALLLFLTNALAIITVGGLTFILTGVTPVRRVAQSQRRLRTALGTVATIGVIVFAGLLVNGIEATTDAILVASADAAVEDWLERGPGDPVHSLVETRVEGDEVTVVIVGPSEGVPEVDRLAEDLQAELGRPVTVDLRVVVEERLTASAS